MDDEIIEKLKGILKLANVISFTTTEIMKEKDDYYDELDSELKEMLHIRAHGLIDDLGIRAKG